MAGWCLKLRSDWGTVPVFAGGTEEAHETPRCPDWATQTCLGAWDECSSTTLWYLATGIPWIVCVGVRMKWHTYTHVRMHTHTWTEELDCILLWKGRFHVTQHGESSLNYWQWTCACQLVAYCIPTHLPVFPHHFPPPSSPFIALCRLILIRLDCLLKRAKYVTGSYVRHINS
jgi:hypothetical protein